MTPNEIRKWQRQQKHLNRVITIALILLIILAAEIYRSRFERREEHTLRALPSSVFLSLPHPVTETMLAILGSGGSFMGISLRDGVASERIGTGDQGCPLKADTKVLDRTLYLPSFTEEMAYITTKKAKSRVMKSA